MLGVPAGVERGVEDPPAAAQVRDRRRAGHAAFVEGSDRPGADQRRVRVRVGPRQAAVGRLHDADALLEVGRVGARVEAVDARPAGPASRRGAGRRPSSSRRRSLRAQRHPRLEVRAPSGPGALSHCDRRCGAASGRRGRCGRGSCRWRPGCCRRTTSCTGARRRAGRRGSPAARRCSRRRRCRRRRR